MMTFEQLTLIHNKDAVTTIEEFKKRYLNKACEIIQSNGCVQLMFHKFLYEFSKSPLRTELHILLGTSFKDYSDTSNFLNSIMRIFTKEMKFPFSNVELRDRTILIWL